MAEKKRRKLVDVVAMGSLGGTARAERLSKDQLQESGRKAIAARWKAYYEAHPEKLAEREAKARRKGAPRGRPKRAEG